MLVEVGRANRATRGMASRAGMLLVAVAVMVVFLVGISEPVAAQDALFRLGGNVVVPAGERTIGDVVALGGAIEILGEVDGDVVAIGGMVTIDGTVRGDVVAVGGSVTIGAGATVNGDVMAVGGTVQRHPEAIVLGEVNVVNFAQGIRLGLGAPGYVVWPSFGYSFSLLYVAGLFALALVVLAAMPDKVNAIESHMETNVGRSMLIGLLAIGLLVPLTLVLVLTLIGPPILWLGFFAAKMIGYVALVNIVGRKVTERFVADVTPIWQVVAGVIIVAVLRYMPMLGVLFTAVATVWSLGAVLDTKFGTNRPWLPPRRRA